jgi:hypothetical protein
MGIPLTAPLVFATIMLVIPGCAGPASSPTSPSPQPTEATASPKRITVAIRGAPHGFYNKLVQGVPGSDAVEELVNAGLAHSDDRGELRAQLAEVVPTVENGLWRVFPDGRMGLSWTRGTSTSGMWASLTESGRRTR